MDEKKAKELTDSIFNKLNDQERIYLAWVHHQKNKQIQEFKEEHKIMKQILIEHGLWEILLNDDRFLNHLRSDK